MNNNSNNSDSGSNPMEHGVRLVVRYPVPSLNKLFAMSHWERHQEKKRTQAAFASALQAIAADYLTPTTSLGDASISSIVAAIRDSSQMIDPKTSTLLRSKRKSDTSQKKKP
jgi:hypothetical protein